MTRYEINFVEIIRFSIYEQYFFSNSHLTRLWCDFLVAVVVVVVIFDVILCEPSYQ